MRKIEFRSLEAGAKLLSAKNRALVRLIAERRPESLSELAVRIPIATRQLLIFRQLDGVLEIFSDACHGPPVTNSTTLSLSSTIS